MSESLEEFTGIGVPITLIAAMSENRVIGVDGDLPWHLPDDLKHFMRTTTGHVLVMGRRTWESFDGPLPNRTNIVVTSQKDYDAPGAIVVDSLKLALTMAADIAGETREVFITGGGEIYAQTIDMADALLLTVVHATVEGDARFPEFDEAKWALVDERRHDADERHAHAFSIRWYEKKR